MLVENLHHKRANIILPDICDCVEVDATTFKVVGQVTGGSVMVDGLGVGDVGNTVLRDRLTLAEDGILVCVAGIDKRTGKLVSDIEIVSRGCFFAGDGSGENPLVDIRREVANELNRALSSHYTLASLKTSIQRAVKHYFRTTYKRNPVVLPIILEI